MSNNDVAAPLRGFTEVTGRTPERLGRTWQYPNLTSLATTGVQTIRDGRLVTMMWVLNGEASLALLPGQLVAWKTALDGTTVVYPAASAGVQIVGVVDHLLPTAGCAAGSECLITVLGPTKFLLDANATSAEFDNLINSASVAGCVRTGTTSGAIVGRNENRATAAAGAGAIGTATSFWGTFRPN
jgi:hypothetical protein